MPVANRACQVSSLVRIQFIAGSHRLSRRPNTRLSTVVAPAAGTGKPIMNTGRITEVGEIVGTEDNKFSPRYDIELIQALA